MYAHQIFFNLLYPFPVRRVLDCCSERGKTLLFGNVRQDKSVRTRMLCKKNSQNDFENILDILYVVAFLFCLFGGRNLSLNSLTEKLVRTAEMKSSVKMFFF